MQRKSSGLVVSALLLLAPVGAEAQVDLSSVTARLGVIRTFQSESYDAGHLWSLYPELQVGGELFTPSVTWGLSWGYWADGLDHEIDNVTDYATSSQKGHIVVLRIAFEPQKVAPRWAIPLKIFAGGAKHIIYSRHIGGADNAGYHLPTGTYYSTTWYGGLSLAFSLSSQLQIEAEVAQFFPASDDPFYEWQKNRRDFKLGLAVNI